MQRDSDGRDRVRPPRNRPAPIASLGEGSSAGGSEAKLHSTTGVAGGRLLWRHFGDQQTDSMSVALQGHEEVDRLTTPKVG